jgi:hypothetical protein
MKTPKKTMKVKVAGEKFELTILWEKKAKQKGENSQNKFDIEKIKTIF